MKKEDPYGMNFLWLSLLILDNLTPSFRVGPDFAQGAASTRPSGTSQSHEWKFSGNRQGTTSAVPERTPKKSRL
jgi:hypothetical protein